MISFFGGRPAGELYFTLEWVRTCLVGFLGYTLLLSCF